RKRARVGIAGHPSWLGGVGWVQHIPRVTAWVVMEPGEDPTEHTRPGLPAPAIWVAVALPDPGGLLRSRVYAQDVVPDLDGDEKELHTHGVTLGRPLDNSGPFSWIDQRKRK